MLDNLFKSESFKESGTKLAPKPRSSNLLPIPVKEGKAVFSSHTQVRFIGCHYSYPFNLGTTISLKLVTYIA